MSVEKYLRLHIHFHAKQQQQSMFGDRVKKKVAIFAINVVQKTLLQVLFHVKQQGANILWNKRIIHVKGNFLI